MKSMEKYTEMFSIHIISKENVCEKHKLMLLKLKGLWMGELREKCAHWQSINIIQERPSYL